MNIFVDIDETICSHPHGDPYTERDYTKAGPINENINKINTLYKKGHKITYWTAGGSLTNINWRALTNQQLREWGALHHELRVDKPYYHLFICDKAINSDIFFKSNIL